MASDSPDRHLMIFKAYPFHSPHVKYKNWLFLFSLEHGFVANLISEPTHQETIIEESGIH